MSGPGVADRTLLPEDGPGEEEIRIRAELARLKGQSSDPFAAAVRATRMPIVVTDPRQADNPIVFANDAFCLMTGYARDEVVGRNCRFLQGPHTDPAVVQCIRDAIAGPRALEVDIRNHRKNGEPFWNRLMMAPVYDSGGELAYFFASQVDVTLERERLAGLENHNAALIAEIAGRRHLEQESETRLRLAAEAGGLGIWEFDLITGDLSGSALLRQMFGRDAQEPLTYGQLRESIHPDDRSQRQALLERAIETGCEFNSEHRVLRPGGDVGWLHVRGQVFYGPDRQPERMTGVTVDVTDRRRTETELRQTNALLRTILETASGLIYAKDRDGRMLIANGPTLDLIGKPLDEVKGKTDVEFLGNRCEAEAVMANDRRVMETGEIQVVEESVGTENDRARIWLSTKAPMRSVAGEVVGIVGVSQDITQRKRIEEELQQLNATLEARVAERTRERDRTWNNSQDLLVVVDTDGLFKAVNPAWTTVLGWLAEELTGQGILGFIHPDDLEASRQALVSAATQVLPRFENRLRHKDGTWRWISWVAAPEAPFIYASGRHVTVEREAAAALARAEEALRQAQKMEAVGQLTGGIAHDFNNLLTGITGSLELVQRRVASGRFEGLDRYTSAAITSAQRAAALTQRLLAFARRQPLDPKRVEANRLVAGMEDLLRRTLGPTIDLEMVLAGAPWPTLCDPNQLESAVLNLAINARDAMPTGGRLTIETANMLLDDAYARAQGGEVNPGQYVAISVSDTGTGMPPEVIERAFEPFFTTKPTGQGTGLGLSMLYGFVRQSGGHVRIYSEVGTGTTFKVYLPRFRGSLDESGADEPGEAGAKFQAETGETVLVVDDEATVRMLVVETLEELGYAALEASDGIAGLRVLESDQRVDLLVTDVGMPGLNGRQLADAARVLRPGLRILFMTGYAHNAAIGHGSALQPGMEIVTKPFALETLAAKIRAMLEGRAF